MATKRTKVWLTAATRERLAQLAQKWAEEMATDWAPGTDGMHVSAERVILELIRRDEAHRAAARRQRARRTAGRRLATLSPEARAALGQ